VAIVIAAIAGYLLGSIPFGLIFSKRAGKVDLRDYGSGKTGFTNSLRVLGLRRSLPVFTGDLAKGLCATLVPLLFTDDPWARAAGGMAAIAGHIWPVFAGFRGGRGVLTGAGALIGLNPLAALLVAPVVLLVAVTTRYMSAASISGSVVAALAFILFAIFDDRPAAYGVAASIASIVIIVMHRDNIARLLAGTERKIGSGSARPENAGNA
jgi:glycerol-3-phosphate acyltransferase PlsY